MINVLYAQLPTPIFSEENVTAVARKEAFEKAFTVLQNKGYLPCLYGCAGGNGADLFYFAFSKPEVSFLAGGKIQVSFPVVFNSSENDLTKWTTGDIVGHVDIQYLMDANTISTYDGIEFTAEYVISNFRDDDIAQEHKIDNIAANPTDDKRALANQYSSFTGLLFAGNLDLQVPLTGDNSSPNDEMMKVFVLVKKFTASETYGNILLKRKIAKTGLETIPEEKSVHFGSQVELEIIPK